MNIKIIFSISFFIFLLSIQSINSQDIFAEKEDVQTLLENASNKIVNEEYKDALEILNQVLEKDSENKYALRNVGSLLSILGELEEAYKVNLIYHEMYPDDLDAYNALGVTLVKMERYNEGLDIFQNIIKNNNDYLPALENRKITIELMDLEKIEESKYLVFAQIEIRDANNTLIGFFESHRITHLPYHPIVDEYLDSQEISYTKVINGKKYDVWEINQDVTSKHRVFIGNTVLQTPNTTPHFTIFSAMHHGYVLDIGDQTLIHWTISRSLE